MAKKDITNNDYSASYSLCVCGSLQYDVLTLCWIVQFFVVVQ